MAPKLTRVKALWHDYNSKYFGGALTEPPIRFTRALKYYGDFVVSDSGGHPTLRLSSRLNTTPELLRDTLLHEMVHQYLWETGFPDWYCHGEAFRSEAARIGICVDGC